MLIPMSIILQSCLGSIASFYVLKSIKASVFGMLLLSVPVFACMLYNAAVLAQLNKHLVFNLLLVSLAVNTTIILFFLEP